MKIEEIDTIWDNTKKAWQTSGGNKDDFLVLLGNVDINSDKDGPVAIMVRTENLDSGRLHAIFMALFHTVAQNEGFDKMIAMIKSATMITALQFQNDDGETKH